MKRRWKFFAVSGVVLSGLLAVNGVLRADGANKPTQVEFTQKIQKLQLPFIANEGQADERVSYYANTFGGMVFVTKEGEIVYSLPKHEEKEKDVNHKGHEGHEENTNVGRSGTSPKSSGVVLKEEFVGAKVSGIKGEQEAVTKVSYFKGNDSSKWKSDISTYEQVDLGEVYKGIGLKLKAYGKNVEKLFTVKPGADPKQIKISLSGLKSTEPSFMNVKQPPESPFIKGDFLSPVGGGRGWMSPLEKGARGLSVPLRKGGNRGLSLPVINDLPMCCTQTGGTIGLSVNDNVAPTFMVGSPACGGLWINEEGQLVAETALGPVKFTKPVAYQEIDGKMVEVDCGYVIAECGYQEAVGSKQEAVKNNPLNPPLLRGTKSKIRNRHPSLATDTDNEHDSRNVYGFKVAAYDTTKDLIIDPLLASTFLGGSFKDEGSSIAIDTSGNVYVTGSTSNANFPTTAGAYDTTFNSFYYGDYTLPDVFVSKFNSNLTSLLASTFLGGDRADEGSSIAIDTGGNVYVTGFTENSMPNLPTTPGAYDTSHNGLADVFVSKFNSGLTSLLASTYLGGSEGDSGSSIVIDSGGNVYITGYTSDGTTDLPTTPGAYDTTHNGGGYEGYPGHYDAFVSKFNSNLTTLLASTFLGGSNDDAGNSIAIDGVGNVYITGVTNGGTTAFPITPGAYDTTFNGTADIFVSKFNSGLTSLLASTFLGRSSGYSIYANSSIAVDTSGNVYVTGSTNDANFPTTPGAYDTTYNLYGDTFVSKLNNGLTTLLASTFLGGSSGYEYGIYIAIDTGGNVYVTGDTSSGNFPTPNGYDTSLNGVCDAFVSKFNSSLTNLLASTYLGGSNDGGICDSGSSIAIDTGGNVYVTGGTAVAGFPTTAGAYDTTYNGGWDIFVSKLDSNLSGVPTAPIAPTSLTANAVSSTGIKLTWVDKSSNEDGFKIERKLGTCTSGSPWTQIGTVTAGVITYNDGGLTPNTDYAYQVRAYNNAGNSSYTPCATAKTWTLGPTSPTSLVAKATSSSAIVLTWTDKSSNEVGFRIERKAGTCASASPWIQVGTTTANVATFTNTGLTPNTYYAYQVRAYNNDGGSTYTPCSSAKTGASGSPNSPTNLRATSLSASAINLAWTDNAANETSHDIYRKAGTGLWTKLITVGANVTSYTDTTAINNTTTTTYSYYISACNGFGCSPVTNIAVVPYSPTLMSALASVLPSKYIDASWKDNSTNETGFQLERKNGDCASVNAWAIRATLVSNKITFRDTVITSGSMYSYRARSYTRSYAQPYAYGYSSYTNCAQAKAP